MSTPSCGAGSARRFDTVDAAKSWHAVHAMFVIELIYKVDLVKIDAQMTAHMAFLRKHYAAGTFVVSGRKIPRDGGIIVAAGEDRGQIESIVREDPFVSRGLADYRIIEFRASQLADDMPARLRPSSRG